MDGKMWVPNQYTRIHVAALLCLMAIHFKFIGEVWQHLLTVLVIWENILENCW